MSTKNFLQYYQNYTINHINNKINNTEYNNRNKPNIIFSIKLQKI